ncbi:MAG: hypothetical protein O2931_02200 [Planctomycetota bacterium]|nr:hypothetical protein [Planctomycetota bacterium]MDA1177586.1 hypothetical protein [Planctomycetota bacterium]
MLYVRPTTLRTHLSWFVLTCFLLLGCAPRLRVIQNPGQGDPGIRFYRPKPYLFLTPAATNSGTSRSPASVMSNDGEMVAIELRYLPDFEEEYSLDVRSGWGAANVKIELQDGWNLVSLNQELDSKVDKNLSAIADVMKAIPSVASASPAGLSDQRTVVQASNVPLGFYEAVVSADKCGKKHLYGFRYVGFIPFGTCPICPTGMQSGDCRDGSLPLYGLVFERGVMVFREIGAIGAQEDPAGQTTLTASSERTQAALTAEGNQHQLRRLEVEEIDTPAAK